MKPTAPFGNKSRVFATTPAVAYLFLVRSTHTYVHCSNSVFIKNATTPGYRSSAAARGDGARPWLAAHSCFSRPAIFHTVVHFASPAVLILPAVFNATCGPKSGENWSPADTK